MAFGRPGDDPRFDGASAREKRAESNESRADAEKTNGSILDPFGFIPPYVDPLDSLTLQARIDRLGDKLDFGAPRMATGWKRLDDRLGGGFTIPSLNVIGAPPKSSKSTWARIIAMRRATMGDAVYHLDLENGELSYLTRTLCRAIRVGPTTKSKAFRGIPVVGEMSAEEIVRQWNDAKAQLRKLEVRVDFQPPTNEEDLRQRLLRFKQTLPPDRKLLIVIDSLQKLPGPLVERRATIDGWTRLFERLRFELDAVILTVSEIRRSKDGFASGETAFKESGGIEYAADLALTMTRPTMNGKKGSDATSTLRIELARDSDRDPRGEVAAYAPEFPHYGLVEADLPKKASENESSGAETRASEWILERLADGYSVKPGDLVDEAAKNGISRSTLSRILKRFRESGELERDKDGWKVP